MCLDVTKTYLIDLDGTMYRGDDVIPEAIEFISLLQRHEISFVFVTNNAMRTPSMIREKMQRMGFANLRDEMFFTSAMAAVSYMKQHSSKRRAFCIGEVGLQDALRQGGFIEVEEDAELVFVGLNRKADFALYCEALNVLRQGAILVGTNEDRRLPQGDHFLIGNGAVLKMLEYASEAECIIVGKPSALMMEETLQYVRKDASQCVVIGDNLETDIAFAYDNHVESIMVTTGVHTKEDAQNCAKKPDVVVASLSQLRIK